MKKNSMKLLALALLSTLASGLLLTGAVVSASAADGPPAWNGPGGALKKISVRQNNQVDKSETILPANKGVHVMNFVDNNVAVAFDETGSSVTFAGQLTQVMLSSSVSAGSCVFQVFDSSTTSGITLASYSQELGVPLMSLSSAAATITFNPPLQFQNGLTGLMTGACVLSEAAWTRIGGAQ